MKNIEDTTKSRRRMLAVDDDPDWLEIIKNCLKETELEIVTAEDGGGALSIMEEQSFDLVVLDTNMPGMNGIELLKIIRCRFPHLPIILFFSGLSGNSLSVQEVFQIGANAILGKDQATRHLLPLVTGFLASSDLIANLGQNRSRGMTCKSSFLNRGPVG